LLSKTSAVYLTRTKFQQKNRGATLIHSMTCAL